MLIISFHVVDDDCRSQEVKKEATGRTSPAIYMMKWPKPFPEFLSVREQGGRRSWFGHIS